MCRHRIFASAAASAFVLRAFGELTLSVDVLSEGDGQLPSSNRIVCVDIFANVSSGDTWTAAGLVGITHSGVTLRYANDANETILLENPGLSDRFVTFLSAPRERDAEVRFTNGGAAAAGRYVPPGPAATALPTAVNVAYFSSPPPTSDSPTVSGAIFRVALDLPSGWIADDVFYSASDAIPTGATLAFSCTTPPPATGLASASFDVPALVGFNWFLYHDALAPDFLDQPDDAVVCNGGTVTITARWNSPVPVAYQWQFEGQPIAGESGTVAAGVSQRALNITSFDAGDEGAYRLLLRETPETGRFRYSRPAILSLGGDAPISIAYVSNAGDDSVAALNASTGEFLRYIAQPGTIAYPNGVATDRNGDIYVASSAQDQIIRFDWRTAQVTAVYMQQALLDAPVGVAIKEDGANRWLYGVGYLSENLVRFNIDQPTQATEIIDLAVFGARSPGALTLDVAGRFLIAAEDADVVFQFSSTGAFERIAASGCGLNLPSGMAFRTNGEILVSSLLNDSVLQYQPNGQCVGAFIASGSGGLARPYGLEWTANGDLLVVSNQTNQILRYSGATGAPIGVFAAGLNGPLYLKIASVCDTDCNGNGIADRWEIDLSTVDDCNANGVPDECDEGLVPSFSQVPIDATRCAGGTVQFFAAATGVAPLSYRWRRGAVELSDGPSAGGGTISGSMTATLTITGVGTADSATDYNLLVTSPCGTATSPNARLIVNAATVIQGQPASASACEGSSVTFSVSASGTPPLEYQWFRNVTPIAGATAASYSLSSVSLADQGDYYVVVTGGCGELTSNSANLTVNQRPQILTQPADQTACAGRATAFTVVVSGSSAQLRYQWRFNSQPISGATTATLLLQTVSPIDSGDYDVITYFEGSGCAVQSQAAELIVTAILGDATYDGEVDLLDLTTLLSNFGTQSGADWTDGDFSGDGDVDLSDLTILLSTFGDVCP